ncbi:MAG: hypothetical protein K2N82_06735, partial [Lachnospiraceae bacterium]|nr:hypothetical protein [Lachnospiraceae bacterium]
MKKLLIKILAIGAAGVCLTGCGNAIPEMTPQQQELVVEFAAGELLKFDQRHTTRIVPLEMIQEEEESSQTDSSVLDEKKDPSTDTVKENECVEEEGIPVDEVT